MKTFTIILTILLFNIGLFAQENVVLIAHNNYLIGGTQNGKWIKDIDVSAANLKKTSKFFGFDPFKNEKPSEMYGTFDHLGCSADLFYFGKTSNTPENIFDDETTLKPVLAIGANANWNPLPRIARKIASGNKTYQKIALDLLRTKGLNVRSVKLENVFAVDLEGDGKDEIFLEATTYKNKNREISGSARRGDYTFVLMRKIVAGKPKTFLIKGEFHTRKPADDYLTETDLSAFADLNGDGKMEVILEAIYSYGGVSTGIYELDKTNLREALFVECGD